MIIEKKYGPIVVKERWFAGTVALADAFVPTIYMQCRGRHQRIGFIRKNFETKVIDLSKSEEQLISEIEKTTMYEVRRAKKDGVKVLESVEWGEFVERYNVFAEQKKLRPISLALIETFHPFVRLIIATSDGEYLAGHVYLIDRDTARSRLLYSVGSHRSEVDSKWRAHVGRANRYLHWEAIKLFILIQTSRFLMN